MPVGTFKAPNRISREVFKRVKRAAPPLRPTQLLDDLTQKYSYAAVQDALSDLIEDQRITLTPDRHLIIWRKTNSVR